MRCARVYANVCKVWVGGEVKTFEPFDATKMATCSCSSCFTHVNMMVMVMMSQLRSIVTPHNFVLPNNPLPETNIKGSKQRSDPAIALLFPKCVLWLDLTALRLEAGS